MTDSTAEPLWRVKTKPFVNSDRSYIEFAELNVPGFTEVEVWPVGDRPYAATRLDALRQLRREGYEIVDGEGYRKLRDQMAAGDRTPPNDECAVCGDTGWSGDDPDNSERCACRGGGHRTPTRERIEQAMRTWLVRSSAVSFNWRDEDEAVQGATQAVWALLHGQGDESDWAAARRERQEAVKEILQRVADGWEALPSNDGFLPMWVCAHADDEPIPDEVAAVLWRTTEDR